MISLFVPFTPGLSLPSSASMTRAQLSVHPLRGAGGAEGTEGRPRVKRTFSQPKERKVSKGEGGLLRESRGPIEGALPGTPPLPAPVAGCGAQARGPTSARRVLAQGRLPSLAAPLLHSSEPFLPLFTPKTGRRRSGFACRDPSPTLASRAMAGGSSGPRLRPKRFATPGAMAVAELGRVR